MTNEQLKELSDLNTLIEKTKQVCNTIQSYVWAVESGRHQEFKIRSLTGANEWIESDIHSAGVFDKEDELAILDFITKMTTAKLKALEKEFKSYQLTKATK